MNKEAKAYDRDGYYIHPEPLLPSEIVDQAREGMDAVRRGEYDTGQPPQPSPWNPGDDEDVLCKIEMPQQANGAIRALVGHEALGRWAARVTGAEWVQVWWVQLLYKPSSAINSSHVQVGWHQDRHYWGSWDEGSELFTAWVALSEVGPTSGAMRFVKGSHRWGQLQGGDFFNQDLADQRRGISVPKGAEWNEVEAQMPAGSASFHNALTLHASGSNTSGQPRRSFAIHLRTDKSKPKGGRHEGLTQFIEDEDRCPVIYKAQA